MWPTLDISPDRPVLIAGPTASGKSALAMQIAAEQGGVIVNADSIQVYENWRILSARPSLQDENAHPHHLYGHIGRHEDYSVGHWLRDVTPCLSGPDRPIIVGGTGLYFTALTEGLAQIPEIPADIRTRADARLGNHGIAAMLSDLDAGTAGRIDHLNPMRVQRAWEVLHATGRGLAHWQDNTPPPALPLDTCHALVVDAPRDWLIPRIEARFDLMLANGALDEVRENMADWNPDRLSSRAIGAPELISYLRDEMTLDQARTAATIATRQYAKRQRTWFRARMKSWLWITPPGA